MVLLEESQQSWPWYRQRQLETGCQLLSTHHTLSLNICSSPHLLSTKTCNLLIHFQIKKLSWETLHNQNQAGNNVEWSLVPPASRLLMSLLPTSLAFPWTLAHTAGKGQTKWVRWVTIYIYKSLKSYAVLNKIVVHMIPGNRCCLPKATRKGVSSYWRQCWILSNDFKSAW